MAEGKRPTQCLACRAPLPAPLPGGGRPRKFCSDRCRWAMRRKRRKLVRSSEARHQRLVDTKRERRAMRQQAERLAQAAGAAALTLPDEDQLTAMAIGGKLGPIAGYTRTALPVLARARALLASAVTADRAAGATWEEIAAALDVSADTAARRFRSR